VKLGVRKETSLIKDQIIEFGVSRISDATTSESELGRRYSPEGLHVMYSFYTKRQIDAR